MSTFPHRHDIMSMSHGEFRVTWPATITAEEADEIDQLTAIILRKIRRCAEGQKIAPQPLAPVPFAPLNPHERPVQG